MNRRELEWTALSVQSEGTSGAILALMVEGNRMKYCRTGFISSIAAGVAMLLFAPVTFAGTCDLVIGETALDASGTERLALVINGSVLAPRPPGRA